MIATTPLFRTSDESWSPTSDDHYTPAWVFETMALTFDLDVASPPGGIPWIPTERYYTIHDDGLTQPWDGLVWCNPPFGAATVWANRWSTHPDGVFLGPFAASAWLHRLIAASDVVWIPPTKLDFEAPEGGRGSISYMTFVAGRGQGTAGVERLSMAGGTLVRPVE